MDGLIVRFAGQAWVHVLVAFAAMGGWALFVNVAHPMPAPLVAGLVQGTLSGVITFTLKSGLDAMRLRLSRAFGWWLPPLAASALSLGCLVTIHVLARTPEIIGTIALPFSVASGYALTYNFIMWRKEPHR